MSQAQQYADVTHTIFSKHRNRDKFVEVFLPPSYQTDPYRRYPVVYMNDGQDSRALELRGVLFYLNINHLIEEVILVAIHTDHDRIREYGVGSTPDYANRGDHANEYSLFLIEELLPFINQNYRTLPLKNTTAIFGFSLSALAAFDIAWNHANVFGYVGAFSASFWWRRRNYEEGYTDDDRIMHKVVREGEYKEGLRFWFETGTNDETSDRNNSGIIDVIEDTLDLISELEAKGYSEENIRYLEIQGGEHNPQTWSKAIPDFLVWVFGVKPRHNINLNSF